MLGGCFCSYQEGSFGYRSACCFGSEPGGGERGKGDGLARVAGQSVLCKWLGAEIVWGWRLEKFVLKRVGEQEKPGSPW